MKLIVGLGNPGNAYIDSRHNIGFSVIRALSKTHKTALRKEFRVSALTGKFKLRGEVVLLAMPLTFMNLSGSAVKALLKKYKINFHNLLVISDDLDLGLGRIKIRPSGSSAGHRGIQSIIDALASERFTRLRIGIGRHADSVATATYVLSEFTKKEQSVIRPVIERACDCCEAWVIKGLDKTMNIFNSKTTGA